MRKPLWSAGIVVVLVSFSGPLQGSQAGASQEWDVVPAVVAGAFDGPGSLADALHVDLGPNGEILVAQATVQEVAVFDERGEFMGSFGRRGQGPGEFSILGRIGWRGDDLWTLDIGGMRIHLWDWSFELRRTITPMLTEPPEGVARILAGPWLGDGYLLGIPMAFEDHGHLPVLIVSEEGRVERTVARFSTEGRSVEVQVGGVPRNVPTPWPDYDLWDLAPDGEHVVVVRRRISDETRGAGFRVVRIHVSGDTVMDRSIPYAPAVLDRATVDRTLKERAERVPVTWGVTQAAFERVLRTALHIPRHLAPVRALRLGRDGSIWVQRERMGDDPNRWQVLTEDGDELAWISLPDDLELHGANGHRIWGVTKDQFDVPFVRVYEIKR